MKFSEWFNFNCGDNIIDPNFIAVFFNNNFTTETDLKTGAKLFQDYKVTCVTIPDPCDDDRFPNAWLWIYIEK